MLASTRSLNAPLASAPPPTHTHTSCPAVLPLVLGPHEGAPHTKGGALYTLQPDSDAPAYRLAPIALEAHGVVLVLVLRLDVEEVLQTTGYVVLPFLVLRQRQGGGLFGSSYAGSA